MVPCEHDHLIQKIRCAVGHSPCRGVVPVGTLRQNTPQFLHLLDGFVKQLLPVSQVASKADKVSVLHGANMV